MGDSLIAEEAWGAPGKVCVGRPQIGQKKCSGRGGGSLDCWLLVSSNTLYQLNQVTFINVSDHEVVVRMITRYLALQRYWDLERG